MAGRPPGKMPEDVPLFCVAPLQSTVAVHRFSGDRKQIGLQSYKKPETV